MTHTDTHTFSQTTLFVVSKSILVASLARHCLSQKKKSPQLGPPNLQVPDFWIHPHLALLKRRASGATPWRSPTTSHQMALCRTATLCLEQGMHVARLEDTARSGWPAFQRIDKSTRKNRGDSFSWYRDVFFLASRFFDLFWGIEIFFVASRFCILVFGIDIVFFLYRAIFFATSASFLWAPMSRFRSQDLFFLASRLHLTGPKWLIGIETFWCEPVPENGHFVLTLVGVCVCVSRGTLYLRWWVWACAGERHFVLTLVGVSLSGNGHFVLTLVGVIRGVLYLRWWVCSCA